MLNALLTTIQFYFNIVAVRKSSCWMWFVTLGPLATDPGIATLTISEHFEDSKLQLPMGPIVNGHSRILKWNIPTTYGLIWYSTSSLGSWNSHGSHWDPWIFLGGPILGAT